MTEKNKKSLKEIIADKLRSLKELIKRNKSLVIALSCFAISGSLGAKMLGNYLAHEYVDGLKTPQPEASAKATDKGGQNTQGVKGSLLVGFGNEYHMNRPEVRSKSCYPIVIPRHGGYAGSR